MHQAGFVAGRPRDPAFKSALEQALAHMRGFLGL